MSDVKKFFGGLLAVSIGLIAIAPLTVQPIQAQTQNFQQQKLKKLQQEAAQQTQQGKPTEAFATFQQVLVLARQLQDKKAEATALSGIGEVYGSIGQPQKALEFFNQALPIRREIRDRNGAASPLRLLISLLIGKAWL